MLNIGVIVPDPETNGVHIPYAKSQLRAFAREWRGHYMSRTIRVDRAIILMEMWAPENGRVSITSALPYMESGFLDHRTVLQGFANAYKPALVKFSPAVAALSGTPGHTNARGHKLSDGDETWTAAGCKPTDKVEIIDREIGTAGNRVYFESSPAEFCEPDQIINHKLLCELFPPSVFTGKMRLYVQALYGSLRKDFYLDTSFSQTNFVIRTGDVDSEGRPRTVPFQYTFDCAGLYTISPGKYLWITITTQGVTFRKMVPRTAAKASTTDEQEAYILSGLTPKFESQAATGPALPAGVPLAYGWHFNESGHEASIVLLRSKDLAGVAIYANTPITGGGFGGSLHRLRFSWDAEDEALSYTLTSGSEIDFHPRTQSKVWYPSPDRNGMLLLGGFTTLPVYGNFGPAPVYCYYNMADELVTATVKNTTLEITPARNDFAGITDSSNGAQIFKISRPQLPLSITYRNLGAGYSFAPNGVRVGATEYYGAMEFYPTGGAITEFSLVPNTRPGPPTGEGSEGSGNGTYGFFDGGIFVQGDLYYTNSIKSRLLQTTVGTWYDNATNIFVVPHGDASACLVGRETHNQRQKTGLLDYRYGNNSAYYFDALPPNGGYTGNVSWGFFGSLIWQLRSTIEEANAVINKQSIVDSSMLTQMFLFAGNANGTLLAEFSASDSGLQLTGFPTRPYKQLFGPSGAATYPGNMTVRTSYFGAVRHDYCLPETGSTVTGYLAGWPTDADTPIGWA